MEQGTEEWFRARCGRVTASRVADVVATTKSGPSASRASYMGQLIAERLTGAVADSYSNAAMQHGVETEPRARAAYEFRNDVDVEQIGFVDHPEIANTGASPDGLVGKEGMLEIKCPNTSTHINTLLTGRIPAKHDTQMQWQMACASRDWCDFVSYDGRMPEHLAYWCKRVERDNERIADLEAAVAEFITELETKIAALDALGMEK